MSEHPDTEDCDDAPLQFDYYGIKARGTPSAPHEPAPRTWKEVGHRLNRRLMAIADNFLGVFEDALKGIRSVIRGVCGLPSAVANRVSGAHREADQRESDKQLALEAPERPELRVEQPADDRLVDWLQAMKAKGLHVEFRQRDDGQWYVAAVRPELADAAAELADGESARLEHAEADDATAET